MIAYLSEDDELYAELPASDDEYSNYDDLKAEVIRQAKEIGIAEDELEFL